MQNILKSFNSLFQQLLYNKKEFLSSQSSFNSVKMHRIAYNLNKLSKFTSPHIYSTKLLTSMSGIKIKNTKKSSSTVFAQLSEDYLQRYNQKSITDQAKSKPYKQANRKATFNPPKVEEDMVKTQDLKNSWLGNALEDDLYLQTRQWQHEAQREPNAYTQEKSQQSSVSKNKQKGNTFATYEQKTQRNKNLQNNEAQSPNYQNQAFQFSVLKTKSFKKQLSKTEHIDNSRKFLDLICNLFPRYQVERIIAEIKQFCSKRDLNMPSFVGLNVIQNEKMSFSSRKIQQKKIDKQQKLIEKITKEREKKLFMGVRRIFDECLSDVQLIDNLLGILSQSDPYIMNNQGIHKLIYNHSEGVFDDQANQHKAQVNVILDKKQRQSLLSQKNQDKSIDELIEAKKDFFKESQEIINKSLNKKQKSVYSLEQQSQQDLINVFEEFSISLQNQKQKQKKHKIKEKETKQEKNPQFLQKQRQQKKFQRNMRLIVKKNLNVNDKSSIPEQFQITQHSLHEIERILFKNKKIVEDNVVFKKVKLTSKQQASLQSVQKQRQQFGRNWIYGYEMPYGLTHQTGQQFIDYISTTYGDILEYYIFPYKNMLEKRENIMIHIENQKNLKKQNWQKQHGLLAEQIDGSLANSKVVKQEKQSVADRLLEKIEKQKNLKLNKSSMVFKFRSEEAKRAFLMPEMRLYGINFKTFRNIRFQEAQSKNILAISMIPWGCSSEALLKAINKELKSIDVQVSYQSCILAKGFIFIEFDNFYQSLNGCSLLNNLEFQGHNLKVQINYGSSKLYGQKYKNTLQFDHYETLVKKLKDIKCFYNEVYQD